MVADGFKREGVQGRGRINTSLHISKAFEEKRYNCFDITVRRVESLWFEVRLAFELFYLGSLVQFF